MTTARRAPADIDDYIAGFPAEVQTALKRIRTAIQKAVPEAEEAISYQIPTFRLNGRNLIHFAAFKQHVGLYPAPREDAEFKDELSRYGGGKGTVQFPFGEPLPLDLIKRIVRFRARKSSGKAAVKKSRK
jgi:uncharacterized protein YdhG (YjbR/CyaY superfamily)